MRLSQKISSEMSMRESKDQGVKKKNLRLSLTTSFEKSKREIKQKSIFNMFLLLLSKN